MVINRLLIVAALIALSATAFGQGKRANFAGTWELDLKKSVNLQPQFNAVESYTIDITQSGDSLTVLATLKGKGQTVPFPAYVYVMNGKETHRVDSLRGSERWITARWGKDGKSASMDTKVKLTQKGKPPVELNQHDDWKLENASTMRVLIKQKMAATDSTRSENRIFRKQK